MASLQSPLARFQTGELSDSVAASVLEVHKGEVVPASSLVPFHPKIQKFNTYFSQVLETSASWVPTFLPVTFTWVELETPDGKTHL